MKLLTRIVLFLTLAFTVTSLLGLCVMVAYGQPILPIAPMATESAVVVAVTNPPIRTTLAWDSQSGADAFSVVVGGQTNLTTLTSITVDSPSGTNRLEIRAHKGALASQPVITNLVVAVVDGVTIRPATKTNNGPMVAVSAFPTGVVSRASMPMNTFIGWGAIITSVNTTNLSLQ